MSLTADQKRDALILHAQGDTPEAIARHVIADIKDVRKVLPRKQTRTTTAPEDVEPEDVEPEDVEPEDVEPALAGDED